MRPFESYSWQHFLPILGFLLAGAFMTLAALGSTERRKKEIGIGLALLTLAFMVGGSLIKHVQGTFNILEDLPLYLCRIIAWMLPLVIWYKSRFWLGVFYFWVLAGTLQGIITPDLAEGFPSFQYFRYWFLHAGLVTIILYTTVVFRMRITWRDFWRALIGAQIYIVIVHMINLVIGSNYSYTVRKPPGPSLLDLFGEWPWYILGGEALMLVLFLLLMLPWMPWGVWKKREMPR